MSQCRLALLIGQIAFWESLAAAQPVRPVQITGASTCPSPAQVAAELVRLVHTDTDVRVGEGEGRRIAVADAGETVHVDVEGAKRAFADPARHCAERARAVAVFAALVFELPKESPPESEMELPLFPDPPPASSSSPQTPSPPAPAPSMSAISPISPVSPIPPVSPTPSVSPISAISPIAESPKAESSSAPIPAAPSAATPPLSPRPAITMVLELVGSLDAAPIAGATTLGGGAMLRGTLSWGHFGLTVGLGGESQGTIALAPGDVQLVRAPLDFGLRAQLRRDRLEANMDLGPIVSLLFVRGQGYGENLSGVGIDAGARLAIGGRAWLTPRFAVVLGIEASYYPVPTTLRVDHGGADGVAPSFWTGAVAGIATRL